MCVCRPFLATVITLIHEIRRWSDSVYECLRVFLNRFEMLSQTNNNHARLHIPVIWYAHARHVEAVVTKGELKGCNIE